MADKPNYDPQKHHRRSIRLKDYDYSQAGAYFVTICTYNRVCLFGEIANGKMHLNEYGETVCDEWLRSSIIRPNVELDEWVVMPNHIHGIVVITRRGTSQGRGVLPTDGRGVLPTDGRGVLPTDGRGELPTDGRGVLPTDGRGELPTDGRGELPTDGRGELPTEGRGVLPTDGRGVLPTDGRGVLQYAPTGMLKFQSPSQTIGAIVRGFKSAATKRINIQRDMPGVPVWQRNYWEHIIRNEQSYINIATYIINNPAKWESDKLYATM
jgi:REP element-mobilizing transposase RayT